MNTFWIRLVAYTVLLVSGLAMYGCGEQDSASNIADIDFNKEGREITLTVTVFDTYADLQRARNELTDNPNPVEGFALLNQDGTGVGDWCKIYVQKIDSVRDERQMTTWGHELAHCLYGTYHAE